MSGEEIVTVSVWPLAVSAARLATLKTLLSADEQERAGKIKHESVAREFIVSRGITREVLASACGCTPVEIGLAIGAHGKPLLAHPTSRLSFNLSHSGGYCALAVGAFPALGVDIEALRETVGDIAKNVFSAREVAGYAAVPLADRMRVFFRGWVAKEAYLKATGTGLAGGLKSLELDLTATPDIRPLAINGDEAAAYAWRIMSFDVTNSITGAIAVATGGRDIKIRIRHISAE